jgi:hypothetical protein
MRSDLIARLTPHDVAVQAPVPTAEQIQAACDDLFKELALWYVRTWELHDAPIIDDAATRRINDARWGRDVECVSMELAWYRQALVATAAGGPLVDDLLALGYRLCSLCPRLTGLGRAVCLSCTDDYDHWFCE